MKTCHLKPKKTRKKDKNCLKLRNVKENLKLHPKF